MSASINMNVIDLTTDSDPDQSLVSTIYTSTRAFEAGRNAAIIPTAKNQQVIQHVIDLTGNDVTDQNPGKNMDSSTQYLSEDVYGKSKTLVSIDIGPQNTAIAVFDCESVRLIYFERIELLKKGTNSSTGAISDAVVLAVSRIIERCSAQSTSVVLEYQLKMASGNYSSFRTYDNGIVVTAFHACFATLKVAVEYVHPKTIQAFFGLPTGPAKKNAAVKLTETLLAQPDAHNFLVSQEVKEYFKSQSKKDDLADAFLQGLWSLSLWRNIGRKYNKE